MIRCQCGKVIFDGLILKIRVGQFSKGYMNLKCPQCKSWINGIPVDALTGGTATDIDFSKTHTELRET